MFMLPDSDLILPVPKEALYSANRLKLPLRAFPLPISLPTLVLAQSWHPRFDKDPAHKWLRETLRESLPRHLAGSPTLLTSKSCRVKMWRGLPPIAV